MLKRTNRLSKETDIKRVLKKGKRTRGSFVSFIVLKNDLDYSRFTVVVGMKVSKKAVDRNRLKRQVRSVIEKEFDQIKPGVDVMVLVNPSALNQSFEKLNTDVIQGLKKAKLL